MRVLIAASTFPRWPQDDLPDFVWQQARHLARAYPDIEVFVLAPHHPGARFQEAWEGVRIFRIPYLLPLGAQTLAYPAIWPNLQERPGRLAEVPGLLATQAMAAAALMVTHEIDLLYSHWFMPMGVGCGLAASALGIPQVLTTHASDVSVLGRVPVLGPATVRHLLPHNRAISTAGQRGVAKMARFFSPEVWHADLAPRVRVLPMGVSEDAILGVAHAPADGTRRIVFLGRLAEKKGVPDLLEAFAALAPEHPRCALLIAGDGPLRADLERRAQVLGLGARVQFLGFVQGAAKASLLAAADVFVVPSIITSGGDAEGLPVSLLEALAAGLLVVATDVSGADDLLVDGQHGFLVPARDPAALASAIRRALTLEGAEADRMRQAARTLGERFHWRNVIREHHAHLIAPLAGHARSRRQAALIRLLRMTRRGMPV